MIEPAQLQHQHPILLIVIVGVCIWITLSLIVRMWFIHRRVALATKLFWSVVLLIPLFGWIFYAAVFRPPTVSESRAPTEHSRDAYAGAWPPNI
jgi:hypothetical protein